tara:strand:+ start:111003 stop:111626 length:624 start_codon:yes stop_codon:yes gene_type:complete
MKTIKFLTLSFIVSVCIACGEDENGPALEIEAQTISNIKATQSADYSTNPPTITGDYIRFSFETGTTTTTDNWDVAFRGSTILVNGGTATADDQPTRTGNAGVYITTGTLASVTDVNTSSFSQDDAESGLAITTGSGNGWYTYDAATHIISPIAGKILVVKTNRGNYAKFEILNYYENSEPNEDLSNSQYYTFNYVYQPNTGITTFQ